MTKSMHSHNQFLLHEVIFCIQSYKFRSISLTVQNTNCKPYGPLENGDHRYFIINLSCIKLLELNEF